MIRRVLAVAAVIAGLVPALMASTTALATPVFNQIWVWPGGCGASATLQECITNAAPGDDVQIATDDPIAEAPVIDKTLTLEGQPGFRPHLLGLGIQDTGGAMVSIGVSNIAFSGGVDVSLTDHAGDAVYIDRISGAAVDNISALNIGSNVLASIRVTSSQFRTDNHEAAPVS